MDQLVLSIVQARLEDRIFPYRHIHGEGRSVARFNQRNLERLCSLDSRNTVLVVDIHGQAASKRPAFSLKDDIGCI